MTPLLRCQRIKKYDKSPLIMHILLVICDGDFTLGVRGVSFYNPNTLRVQIWLDKQNKQTKLCWGKDELRKHKAAVLL